MDEQRVRKIVREELAKLMSRPRVKNWPRPKPEESAYEAKPPEVAGVEGGCGRGAWAICTRHNRRWYYKVGSGCTECYLEHGEPKFGSREHDAYMQWLVEHSTGGIGIITGGKQGREDGTEEQTS